jgi:hypothetical protein
LSAVPWQSTQSISTAGRHLAVDVPVAVAVLREVAVDAVEALVQVDRGEVHGLAEFLRDRRRDRLAVLVEERALAVALEDGAEIPAVPVVIGELRVLERRVELRDILQELGIAPASADRGLLGVAVEDGRASSCVGYFCFAGHMAGASDS